MERYQCGHAPEHLVTRSQLKKAGLRLARKQEAVGYVLTGMYHTPAYLYDSNRCHKAYPETEKQKAARAASWIKIQGRWKCSCGAVPATLSDLAHYWRMPGCCESCASEADYQAEQDELRMHMERDHARASNWARDLLAREDWAILDTETTSLTGVVVDLAIIAPDGSTLFNSLINPDGAKMSEIARSIHGLADEQLASAPRLVDVWPDILAALAGRKMIITYNSAFDQARLEQSARRYGLAMPGWEWECAMEAYAEWYGEWSEYHHSYTWQRLDGGHRALGDCLACLERIKEMARS